MKHISGHIISVPRHPDLQYISGEKMKTTTKHNIVWDNHDFHHAQWDFNFAFEQQKLPHCSGNTNQTPLGCPDLAVIDFFGS